MLGVEINMVVPDSLTAYQVYDNIFPIELVEKSDLSLGFNEVVFTLHGVRFHMLDENPDYHLVAPKNDQSPSIWYNVVVEDIRDTFAKALENDCRVIQEPIEIPEMGIANAIVIDPFGHMWLLHQVYRVLSHEERIKVFQDSRSGQEI